MQQLKSIFWDIHGIMDNKVSWANLNQVNLLMRYVGVVTHIKGQALTIRRDTLFRTGTLIHYGPTCEVSEGHPLFGLVPDRSVTNTEVIGQVRFFKTKVWVS